MHVSCTVQERLKYSEYEDITDPLCLLPESLSHMSQAYTLQNKIVCFHFNVFFNAVSLFNIRIWLVKLYLILFLIFFCFQDALVLIADIINSGPKPSDPPQEIWRRLLKN